MQHDALALAVALGLPFVNLRLAGVDLDPIGRMIPGDHKVLLAHAPNYAAFRRWLANQLGAYQEAP